VEERIRTVYAARSDPEREQLGAGDRFIHEERDRAVAELLAESGLLPLGGRRVLEVGCGDGRVLALFRELGADEQLMAGIDLLPDRLARAAVELPRADLRVGSATELPWHDREFDIVLQFTMLSSVIEPDERRRCCKEMRRLLKPVKPGGAIMSYDFVWNPLNRDTRGVTRGELAELFPDARISGRRLTLIPPLARAVAPISTRVAEGLAKVPALRSHYLALLRFP
jgi:ubiquinone/menaquinone biosynthesis C-methylase UbiE